MSHTCDMTHSYICLMSRNDMAEPYAPFKQTKRHFVGKGSVCDDLCCNTLQHTTTHCNTLQHTTTQMTFRLTYIRQGLHMCMLRCVAVCCGVLQCVAVCCGPSPMYERLNRIRRRLTIPDTLVAA